MLSAIGQNSGLASPTRGISAGGSSQTNVIQYVTIASTGDAIDFGDLTAGRSFMGAASNSTTGLFSGGITTGTDYNNIVDYITIASTGNAIDFGDLSIDVNSSSAASSPTRVLVAGGRTTGAVPLNNISYFTISTTGNSTSFGDLSAARVRGAGASNAHGGL